MARLLTSLVLVMVGVFAVCQVGFAQTAPENVDLELSLLVDVSGSVDTNEFNLQRTGYVNAFNNSSIVAAIQSGTYGQIAANMIFWSSYNEQALVVPWTLISDATSATAFATAISTAPRTYDGNTGPGSAIAYATPLFFSNNYNGTRLVIDVSGDGVQNSGVSTSGARDAALAAGIDTINGVAIGGGSLLTWYQNNVIGGTDAFAISASTFADFGRAIDDKIHREIDPDGVPEPATMSLLGMGLLGLFGFRKRKK